MFDFGDRSKTFWYKDGDLNTKYFMRQQLHKKKVNRIVSLKDANGAVCSILDEQNVIVIEYFTVMFPKAGKFMWCILQFYILIGNKR
jgi:hypothetical protein